MVRVGGMAYTCAPAGAIGRRISGLKLDNGRPIEAGKSYRVAGWASVNEQTGAPVWEILAKHLRAGKTSPQRGSDVTLKGVRTIRELRDEGFAADTKQVRAN